MPGAGFIDITLTDDGGVEIMRRRVQTWQLHLADHTEPLTQIGVDILQDNAQNFVSEGGAFGHGWAPLAPSTIARKRGPGILVETGELMNSLTIRGAPGNVFRVTSNSLEVGSSNPKAGWHQRGHSSPTRLPQRLVVGWSWEMKQRIVQRFREFVEHMLAQQ